MNKVKKAVLGLGLAAVVAAGPMPFARPAMAQSVEDRFSNLTNLATAASYIGGLGFDVAAILKFKSHKDNPSQVPVGTPVALVFIAGALLFLPSILSVTSYSALGNSCPMFIGSGTLMGEGTCLWSQVSGENTVQGTSTTRGLGWHAGGQMEVGPGWFVGGFAGTGSSSSQGTGGPSSTEQAFDLAGVVKRVDGPLFLSAMFGLSKSTINNVWAISVGNGSGAMTSSTDMLSGGLLLRAAYQFQLDPIYVRPRADVVGGFMSRSGLQESGPSTAVTVDPVSKFGVQIKPMLEVGARADVGSVTLRPYVAAGPTFLPDNTLHLSGSVGGTRYSGDIQGSSVMLNLEAGLQVFATKSWDTKLEYRRTSADQYLDESLNLRLSGRF